MVFPPLSLYKSKSGVRFNSDIIIPPSIFSCLLKWITQKKDRNLP
jgi:hypothetical protein